jgi:hypothetical protein
MTIERCCSQCTRDLGRRHLLAVHYGDEQRFVIDAALPDNRVRTDRSSRVYLLLVPGDAHMHILSGAGSTASAKPV